MFNQDGHLLPGFLDQVPRAYDKRGVFVVRSPSEDSNFWMLVVGSKNELGRMGAARSANGRWYLGESDAASLLAYVVSFRQHQDFHEQCVERIYLDLQRLLQPAHLTVYARYVRRGGLDINPYRSSAAVQPDNRRLVRQ